MPPKDEQTQGARSRVREDGMRKSWVTSYLRRYQKVLAFAIVASVVAYVFAAGLMFTSGYMIALAATLPLTVLALHFASILVRIFGVGKPIIQYFQRLASHDWVLRMTSDVRRRIFLAAEKGAGAIRSTFGEMLGLFTEDIEHIQNLFLRSVFPMIELVILYVVVAIALSLFSPAMALAVLLVVGVCLFMLPIWSVAVNGAKLERQRAIERATYVGLTADVVAAADWRLSGRREEFVRRNQKLYEDAHKEQDAIDGFMDKVSVMRDVLFGLLVAGLACWAASAFGQVGDGNVPVGAADGFLWTGLVESLGSVAALNAEPWAPNWIAAFVLCAFPLLDAFGGAGDAAIDYAKNSVRIDGLGFIEDAENGESQSSESENQRSHGAMLQVRETMQGGEGERWRSHEREQGCDMAEAKETPAYRICLHSGEHVAVVGRSGSGKTTLLESIFSGKPLDWCQVDFDGKRPKIGIVEQDPHIFLNTVRENLLVANPKATDEELLAALDQVNLTAYLVRLPQGLDTLIAEGGTSMSGGERHRLALARILLYDCDVVLLDEPYKHLDKATAQEVSRSLFELFGDKTIIMSTHLMLDEDSFDRVVTLDNLRVVS